MKVKTKGAFITKTNRVISKGEGEIIDMPEADYNEVKSLCVVIDEPKTKVKKAEVNEK